MDKLSERLEAEAATWPIDAISGGPHKLRALLTEAAKLARRVEEAQLCEMVSVRAPPMPGYLPVYQMSPLAGLAAPCMRGQRVRLVREG